MKKLFFLTIMTVIFFGCDPTAQMEANIKNSTSKSLSILFVSSDSILNEKLLISPNQTVLFQEGFDIGNTYLEPSLLDYDSVFIKNQTDDEILKVFKPNDTGKSIYNISDYWTSSEPSKYFFIYEYEIESEDIE